jgi:lipoate-protein ligase A
MGWRYIDTNVADAFFVTAADEVISIARKEKKIGNTLHFYQRKSPTISIGRFRKINEDINLDICKKNKISIVRRTTGGGTIFTDDKCLIYSLVFGNNHKLYSFQNIFKDICGLVIEALKKFDISSIYKSPNDITLNGKKISGSAQIRKNNITLIHGTLLIDTNLELMKSVLKNSINTHVTTIRRELNYLPPINDLKMSIKDLFESYFNSEFINSTFSIYEKEMINNLLIEKYKTDAWNYMR